MFHEIGLLAQRTSPPFSYCTGNGTDQTFRCDFSPTGENVQIHILYIRKSEIRKFGKKIRPTHRKILRPKRTDQYIFVSILSPTGNGTDTYTVYSEIRNSEILKKKSDQHTVKYYAETVLINHFVRLVSYMKTVLIHILKFGNAP